MDVKKHWVNPKTYIEGKEFIYTPPGDKPVSCTIAAYNNPRHQQKLTSLLREFINLKGEELELRFYECDRKAIAGTVLLGWAEGDVMDGDEVVPFSVERAESYMLHVPHFADFVLTVSRNMRNYREAAVTELGKESPAEPSGA